MPKTFLLGVSALLGIFATRALSQTAQLTGTITDSTGSLDSTDSTEPGIAAGSGLLVRAVPHFGQTGISGLSAVPHAEQIVSPVAMLRP